MKSTSGYYCERVEGKWRCLPFDDYKKEGFVVANTKRYEEVFVSTKKKI